MNGCILYKIALTFEFNVGKSFTNRIEFCRTVVAPEFGTAAVIIDEIVSGLDVETVGLVDDDVDGLMPKFELCRASTFCLLLL